MGNRMVTWPMTSRNPERSSCDPQHAYRAQHLENSGRCYLAAMANYLIVCCKPVRQYIRSARYPSDSLASCFISYSSSYLCSGSRSTNALNINSSHSPKKFWHPTIKCSTCFSSLFSQVKKSPSGFLTFFSQTDGNFNQCFIHLLYVPFYTRLQIFIQLSLTLTKLCHIKRDRPTNLYISLEV